MSANPTCSIDREGHVYTFFGKCVRAIPSEEDLHLQLLRTRAVSRGAGVYKIFSFSVLFVGNRTSVRTQFALNLHLSSHLPEHEQT